MNHRPAFSALALLVLLPALPARAQAPAAAEVALPAPRLDATATLEQALKTRRSVRDLAATPLTLDELSRLLWAAQGVVDDKGHRTTPSARATYPLDVWVIAGSVTGLPAGVYLYVPARHALVPRGTGDRRAELVAKVVKQPWIATAPASLVVTATPERAREKMGDRAGHFAPVEAGIAAQNVLLEQVALGLAGTYVGGFDPKALSEFLGLPPGTEAWALLPAGRKK